MPNLKPGAHQHMSMALALKFSERRIDTKGPRGVPHPESPDLLLFVAFRDADPAELREALLDPRRLGTVPQGRWGYYDSLPVTGWGVGGDNEKSREPGNYDLSGLLSRTTSPCLYCNNDNCYDETVDSEDECGGCRRPKRLTRLETLIIFRLELKSNGRLEASMITSANGMTQDTPTTLGVNESSFCGIVTCCDEVADEEYLDFGACEGEECLACMDAVKEAANRQRLEAFLRLPRSRGLWPVSELIGTHRVEVMLTLLALGIPASIVGMMADYHCQALSAPDPIEDITAITVHDIAEAEWQDKERDREIKDEETGRIEQAIRAENNVFALNVMRQSLQEDREDLGKERIRHLVGYLDSRIGFLDQRKSGPALTVVATKPRRL